MIVVIFSLFKIRTGLNNLNKQYPRITSSLTTLIISCGTFGKQFRDFVSDAI